MKLVNINPFIRYAAEILFSPPNKMVIARDCRLFYIVSGKARFEVQNKIYSISDHTLLMINPGVPYKFTSKKPIRLISINFDYTRDFSNVSEVFPPESLTSFKTTLCEVITFDDYKVLNQAICINNAVHLYTNVKGIVDCFGTKQLFSEAKSSAKLKECILEAISVIHNPANLFTNSTLKLTQAANFIQDNFKNDITNLDVAKSIGYHPYYLNDLFKKVMKMTIHQYILNCRISAAEKQLISTNKSITVIAAETGFNSNICFTNNFKKVHNLTPSQFRKKYCSIA